MGQKLFNYRDVSTAGDFVITPPPPSQGKPAFSRRGHVRPQDGVGKYVESNTTRVHVRRVFKT